MTGHDSGAAELDTEELLRRWLELRGAPQPRPQSFDRPDHIPTSYEQQGMWFAQQLRGQDNTSYVIRHAYAIDGPLDVCALSASWRALVERHGPLRTTFALVDGQVTQVVGKAESFELVAQDVADEEALRAVLTAVFREPFDLQKGPVVRLRLYRTSLSRHVLFLVIHHIATDGWSMDVLHRELAALYAEQTGGPAAGLAPLTVEYADLAIAQRRHYAGPAAAAALGYWREQLTDVPASFAPPAGRPRASYRSARLSLPIAPETFARVTEFGRAERASSFMVMLTALVVVLFRWTGQQDLVVGAAIANRDTPESEALIGCFVGVLPLRVRASDDATFAGLLRDVRTALLDGERHRLPYERLLQEVAVDPQAAMSPLFETVVASHHGFGSPLTLSGLTVTYIPPVDLDCPQDLTVYLATAGDGGTVHVDYALDAFEPAVIEGLFAAYLAVVDTAVDQAHDRLAAIGPRIPARMVPAAAAGSETAAPQRPADAMTRAAEELTAAVWQEVLDGPVTRDDNFFLLGGNSSAALRVAAALAERLGMAEVPLRLIYEYSDLTEFAEQLAVLGGSDLGAAGSPAI